MVEFSVRVYHDRASELANAMQLCHDDMVAYASAVGLLAIHSAISFSDAVLLRLTGQRSHSHNHQKAAEVITKACKKAKISADGVKHLERLVSAKSDVAYGDKEVDEQRIEFLYVAAGRFQAGPSACLRQNGEAYDNHR